MTKATDRRQDLLTALRGCQQRLREFIAGRTTNIADAEDVYQEITYQLLKADSYLHPIEQVAAWLFRAARNELIYRSRKKRERLFSDEFDSEWPDGEELAKVVFNPQDDAENNYLRQLILQELDLALTDMPAQQREAFEKTELQGYSYKQLALETGITVETLLSRKHQAVLFLRLRLQGLYDAVIGDE
ncbi:RNA polymerase sigma factor [Candidatus Sodalis endolongispinus]|uniref:RNA polymerase sigma factor n=1 Tax=Candidatus Sodalis endolongispinus TaxID=2812662 RepID=A0ABS5Y7V0_9GAMM|nr:RNA polymerase sigma factor [Candidatus Sodalis endolongispinus]MBT9431031.1 RNA polymerase sigma factor [Candidatus Sodalis endolongispinus]